MNASEPRFIFPIQFPFLIRSYFIQDLSSAFISSIETSEVLDRLSHHSRTRFFLEIFYFNQMLHPDISVVVSWSADLSRFIRLCILISCSIQFSWIVSWSAVVSSSAVVSRTAVLSWSAVVSSLAVVSRFISCCILISYCILISCCIQIYKLLYLDQLLYPDD